jgi:NitT/TauT family transport system substrate-binding protein
VTIPTKDHELYASTSPHIGRRQFLARTTALGASGLLGLHRQRAIAEPVLETTRIRLVHGPFICVAPQYLAEELFPLEGFTRWDYVPMGNRGDGIEAIARGDADISMWDAPSLLPHLDRGSSLVVLAGVHGGCYQLFGGERVRAIRDLKDKTAAIHYPGSGDHIMLSAMLSYVGMDPRDVKWIMGRDLLNAMDLFIEGNADAFMGWAQEPPELRAKNVGHVLVDTGQDRPWSQYFCCMVVANRDFVHRNPIATKRALRAILKAADICAADPQGVARFLAAKLYEPRYPIGLEVMNSTQFNLWRTVNPEDTLRFLALRLREVGMIKSTPQEIIERGSNFSILNELKRELKA